MIRSFPYDGEDYCVLHGRDHMRYAMGNPIPWCQACEDDWEAERRKMRQDEALLVRCSAVSRRFSPDMKLRWMPTVDGNIVAAPPLPFSGFDTRAEAVEAAVSYARFHSPQVKEGVRQDD